MPNETTKPAIEELEAMLNDPTPHEIQIKPDGSIHAVKKPVVHSLDVWDDGDRIKLIIRDVAEIERDPLPGQPDDEMRVTADELRAILEDRLQ